MSAYAVDWALSTSRPRNGQRLLLVALAAAARPDGVCWPSERRLVAQARLSRRSIRRCLRQLERAGELERRTAQLGRRSITVYRIAWPGRRLFDPTDYLWRLEQPFRDRAAEVVLQERPAGPYDLTLLPAPRIRVLPGGAEED